jgi:hypothetical protein
MYEYEAIETEGNGITAIERSIQKQFHVVATLSSHVT